MLWEVIRYFQFGWIKRYYIDPQFHFSYYGFDWIKPVHGDAMYAYFVALGVLAFCIAIGFFYWPRVNLCFVNFCYLFFLEYFCFLIHYFLVMRLGFFLIFMLAYEFFSVV